MEINRSNVFDFANKCNAKPDKDYGQNFLVEPDICSRIVEALDIQNDESVLEIGPGLGSLTHFLALKTNKLFAVDIDERMIAFLKLFYTEKEVTFINQDIRKVDVSKYEKIIGNLPYNITTEIITYLLENAKNAKKLVLMCQNEAFFHFFDVSGKEYGPVSIFIHLLGDIKKVLQVKAGSFYPVPKCGSTVFEINITKLENYENAYLVYRFAKQIFVNRRKTILNNLTNYTKNKDFAVDVLNKLNIDQNKRPEDISPDLFFEMFKLIK